MTCDVGYYFSDNVIVLLILIVPGKFILIDSLLISNGIPKHDDLVYVMNKPYMC